MTVSIASPLPVLTASSSAAAGKEHNFGLGMGIVESGPAAVPLGEPRPGRCREGAGRVDSQQSQSRTGLHLSSVLRWPSRRHKDPLWTGPGRVLRIRAR